MIDSSISRLLSGDGVRMIEDCAPMGFALYRGATKGDEYLGVCEGVVETFAEALVYLENKTPPGMVAVWPVWAKMFLGGGPRP